METLYIDTEEKYENAIKRICEELTMEQLTFGVATGRIPEVMATDAVRVWTGVVDVTWGGMSDYAEAEVVDE